MAMMQSSVNATVAARSDSVSRTWCTPQHKGPDRQSCCVRVDGAPPDRPDLAIYSQDEQFDLGVAPTWDNPDILTNQWGPFRLLPEVSVTVRNLSSTASAVNADVALYISSFGIGVPRSLLSIQRINLAPQQQTTLLFPLNQAILDAAEQRIGTLVQITHPHDRKRINNLGSQYLADAYASVAGRTFTVSFPVMNPLASAQVISLGVLPNQLSAVVVPASQTLAPLEQIVATLALQIPAAVHGTPSAPTRLDATLVGRSADGSLLGGLTYVVFVDN
ncbi:MAG: hypothetical protein JSR59_16905 [Proteobacteria bacterium]|nr:hypothetical protein [Pseudomonadota bacterium]